MTDTSSRRGALASIAGLLVLNGVLLASFLAGVPPHPDVALGPLGGAGPFVGTTIAVGVVAAAFLAWDTDVGYGLALLVVAQNVVTFGPQKLLRPGAALTYPAVVAGSAFAGVLLVAAVSGLRSNRTPDDARVDQSTVDEA